MKRKYLFEFSWWRTDLRDISSAHAEALEETAITHAFEMIKEGYTSGELVDNIHMNDEADGEDGTSYRGHWGIKETL